MRTFFKDLISADNWLIHENGFDPKKINVYESLFTLGNGYMGSRGVLEEIPYDSSSGTYIAGVYDKSISQVPELVNVPNPIDLRIVAEGEKIDIKGMYLHKHQRVLDMKNGLLFRHSILANSRRERFDYKSVRFISHHNKHIGVMRITVTPLDAPAILTVQDNINVSIRNKGVLTEGRKKNFQIREVRSERSINYVCARTQDTGISIACATHLIIASKDESSPAPDQSFDIRLKKGESLTLTKFFYLRTSRHLSRQRLRDSSIKALKKVVRSGFDGMVKRQQAALNKLWKYADVRIEGDSDAQRSLRFNIYHLLISGNPYDDDVSIGAKTLSGEGYRGHIFWDTEVFILPFFIYNFPSIARNLLLYRYHRLEAARRRAKERGYKGVLFPWESADTGEDATPQWHKDLDGSIIPISTQDYEHHIVADIAYGIYHYYQATGDSKFMNAYGAEMIFEAARFWASRVKENKRLRKYVINNVMGPDEFHADVNNNAYTNVMAGWNLEMAANLYYEIKSKYPKQLKRVVRKLKLKE
ncbi:MAG: glycoside hydrolase family 65 protein, partial [Candidatus Omnitrophica bacterium]|nr:glycoside hydrolase family 65 protein [Candidatus Omnitrophota bacterium]